MTSRAVPVFFYGMFMDAELLRAKDVPARVIGHAKLSGFSLRIGQRAAVVRETGGVVHGILMELTQEDVDRLYADPSVRAYRPESVLVHTPSGASVAALCYNLPEPPAASEFDADYATRLRDLALRLELPREYIESIGAPPP